MAATAWTIYNKAKKKIGDGGILLGTDLFRIQLHKSTSNISIGVTSIGYSIASSVTVEVANANKYVTGGKSIASKVWTISSTAVKFDGADVVWSASGGAINSIKYALLRNSAGGSAHAVGWSRLTATWFALADGNTLTLQFATAGIFTLE